MSKISTHPSPPVTKKLNIAALFAISVLLVVLGFFAVVMFDWIVSQLTAYITESLSIDEYYVGKLIGIFFFVCVAILVLILFIIDGDERRLQKGIHQYISKWVVQEYIPENPNIQAALSEGAGVQNEQDSSRAAASVRPKTSALESDYQEGKVDGAFKEFFPNGNLKREIRYLDGKKQGLYRTYYEEGQLEQEVVFMDGEMEGEYRSFYEGGTPHQIKNYKKGQMHGVYKAYDENEIPFFEITYADGIQEGTDTIYDQKGVVQFVDTYKKGICINRKTYDEYGSLKYDQDFEDAIEKLEEKEADEIAAERMKETQHKREKNQDKTEA